MTDGLLTHWVKAASQGQVTGVVLLDLSAAFDLVDHEIFLKKISIYGLDESILIPALSHQY